MTCGGELAHATRTNYLVVLLPDTSSIYLLPPPLMLLSPHILRPVVLPSAGVPFGAANLLIQGMTIAHVMVSTRGMFEFGQVRRVPTKLDMSAPTQKILEIVLVKQAPAVLK